MKIFVKILGNLIIALLFSIFLTPCSFADNLVISGDQIITIDSDYTQVGDILIQDSGTLVVKNGATLNANGYDIGIKGNGALKIENGKIIANKLTLNDDANLDMAQNSKLELNRFISNNRTNITIKKSKISTNYLNVNSKFIDVSSGEVISFTTSSFKVQSFSVSNSTIKGLSIFIETLSETSIKSSVLDGISYIGSPSLHILNSSVKTNSFKANCTSKISITNSTISGFSSFDSSDISFLNSKVDGWLLINSPVVYISISEINRLSSIKANEFFVNNSKILGTKRLNMNISKISIQNSMISRVSSIRANEFTLDNSEILGESSLNINSLNIYIYTSKINTNKGNDGEPIWKKSRRVDGRDGGDSFLSIRSEYNLTISDSKISSGSGGNGGHGSSLGGDGGNGAHSYLFIESKSYLWISNSEMNSGNGGIGSGGRDMGYHGTYGGDGGVGGDSFSSIKSEYNLTISDSKISSGNGGDGGKGACAQKDGGDGGHSSLIIKSESNLGISNSEIFGGNGGEGGLSRGIDGIDGRSSLSITSQNIAMSDTTFNKPFDAIKNNTIAHLTNTALYSINVADNAVVYKYAYVILKVTDKLGNPVSNAKIDVLFYLNETTYKSGISDSNGIAKIPVLSDIITIQGDEFVGNYKVVAYYQNHISTKKGVEMKSNKNIELNFSELLIKPKITPIPDKIELQPLLLEAQVSIKEANTIFADTSEAERLLEQAYEYAEKNELPYAIEYAFRAKESAEKAKKTRTLQYIGIPIFIAISLIIFRVIRTKR